MDNGVSGVLSWLSLLLVVGLTLFWVTRVVGSARKRQWNDCCYALSILLIMWSGLDLITGVIAVLVVIWIHHEIAEKEAKEVDSGDI